MTNPRKDYPILRHFNYDHLEPPLRSYSARFHELACYVASNLPQSAETSTCLRKLLEAKDAAVRAIVEREFPDDR